MATVKLSSAKLPLLVALPVLVLIGIAAAWLAQDDPQPQPKPPIIDPLENEPLETPPPDSDPLTGPDVTPPPRPKLGAPDSVEAAEAMSNEAWGALDSIRSRLELKYKYAEYTLDQAWTLEFIMRKLERLDGTYFCGSDYTLAYPEGEEPSAIITCATLKGVELADGPLAITVNLRTGKTSRTGRVLARNSAGLVLIGDAAYSAATDMVRNMVYSHLEKQAQVRDALAPTDNIAPDWTYEPFESSDFKAKHVSGRPMTAEFACRTLHGETLAEPAVITIDYATQQVTISAVSAKTWMPLPDNRDDYKDRCQWHMRIVARRLLQQLAEGKEIDQPEGLGSLGWALRNANILPFDLITSVSEGSPRKITLEIATNFGRPLPFKRLRYIAQEGDERGAYAD